MTPDFCEDNALEYDDELASLCRSKVRVLFANIILNPFGPTFIMVFAKEDELTPGGVATLYQASLHPSTPEFREIGTIGLPFDWDGSFTEVNCDELAEGLGGASVGFIVPPAWMEDEIRLALLRACYAKAGDVGESLAALQKFPDDIFGRFDLEMGKDSVRPADPVTARVRMIELSCDKRIIEREYRHLIENWSACEMFFLHGNATLSTKAFSRMSAEMCLSQLGIRNV